MNGGLVLQAVVSGAAQGAVYGLVALGFTLVYRLTRVFALAHGDVVVGAVLVAVLVVVGRTPVAVSPGAAASVGLVVLTLLAGTLLSGATYLAAIRPFLDRGAGRGGGSDVTGWVAASVAAGLLLREGLGVALPQEAYAVPDPLRLDRLTPSGLLALPQGATIPVRVVGVLAVGVVVGVAAERLLVRSRVGKALRAVADDPDAAALCGVPVERLVLVAFLAAGLLAGVAGLLDAPGRAVTVDAGVLLGLKGVAAALLGRLGSVRGALVGGLALGVLEAGAVAAPPLGPAYADVFALAVLVVVLALRPEGLRGRPAPGLD